jgi:hypothetical protein
MFCLGVAAVVFGLAGGASADEYHWTNEGDGNSWCNQFNWDPNTAVPGSSDNVVIRRTYIPSTGDRNRGPIVDCDADAASINGPYTNQVMDVISGTFHIVGAWVWEEAEQTSTVNITGSSVVNVGGALLSPRDATGILNISDNPTITVASTKFANDDGSWFEMNMSGGSFTVGGRLGWEDDGGGVLNMSGGATIQCGNFNFSGGGGDPWTLNLNGGTMTVIGRFRAPEDGAGSGNVFINLDAGTLECGEFNHGGGVYAMDINEGMFIIDGDVKTEMDADVNAGYITAFDGTRGVIVTYDGVSDKTTVKADYVKVKASDPSPEDYAREVCPGVELSWDAGAYAVDHNVYFGTSLSDVNESADPCLDHYGSTQWTPPGLVLGTKYYWRVDEVDDANGDSPWVGDIWEFTTNDGNAFDPSPADKKTAVAIDADLYWTAGCGADSHDVYFGTDYNDVRDATTSNHPNVVYENRAVNNFDPGALDYYTWYYWRVDEVDGGNRYKGKVWSFRSLSEIVDPNLILWYKFDESEGPIASDSSGYEHHGSGYDIDGQWEPNNGQIDGCLDFDAHQHVLVPTDTLDSVSNEITVSVWVNGYTGQDEDDDMIIFDTGDGDYKLTGIVPTDRPDLDVYWQAGNDTNDLLLWPDATPEAWRGDWHHFAFVKNENEGKMYIYFDGFPRKSKDCETGTLANVKDKIFKIGAKNSSTSDYDGKLDDFRVYDRALSSDEILEFIRGDLRLAWAPRPYDGRPDVPPDANLVWNAGDYTISHNVYLGTSWEDVNDAVTLDAEFQQNQEPNSYDPPAPFEMGETYYWRIDEVNGPNTWKGPVWRFKVAEFIALDDFEQYDTGDNRIQYTWYDQYSQEWGETTGAWLELARPPKPVYRGEQAMSYTYDTDDPWADLYYAEAWLPLEEIGGFQDWTSVDVRLLTVFFYGQATNDATEDEQMYVGIDDTLGTYAEMRYGDNEGEALGDLLVEEWQSWDIPFVYFGDSNFAAVADDVDFSSIANVYIGFGNKRFPIGAGNGLVYFDDLRLSMPICRPEYGPIGDLSGDCFVGVADIGAMGDQWLRGDVNANPVTVPSDANLVAHWELDGDATDSSASAYHGTAKGGYGWTTGKVGQAIDLSGGWVVVEDEGNTPKLRPKHYVSVMAWVYLNGQIGGDERIVIKGRNDNETFGLEADDDDGAVFIMRDANNPGDVLSVNSGSNVVAGNEWIHIAGTYDNNDQLVYVNGAVEDSNARGAIELIADVNDGLGIGGRYGDGGDFDGKIDDVRVYDRAVTAAEIGYMACGSDGLCPLESVANFYSGESPEIINFKDFAKLFDNWGVEQLWPPEP